MKPQYKTFMPSSRPKWDDCSSARGLTRAARSSDPETREAHRAQLRAMGFDIPDEGSLAAREKLTDINGSD